MTRRITNATIAICALLLLSVAVQGASAQSNVRRNAASTRAATRSQQPTTPKPAYTEKGACAKRIWSGSWWPTWINDKVNPELPNRLRKYDFLTGAKSADWQRADVKKQTPVSWSGFCHGWSASAILLEEPTSTKDVTREGRAQRLTVGDQKAWLAVACSDIRVFTQVGRRCNDETNKETYNDLTPGELWSALSEIVGEEKGSLVLDTEAGVPVWNYPVMEYEVNLFKTNDHKLYNGVISVKFADDSVAYEYVGPPKTFCKEYTFQIPVANGAYDLANATWTGETAAKKDYPDFGWRPLVPHSGNPELSYEIVCELLGRKPVAGPDVDEIESMIDDSIEDEEVAVTPTLPETSVSTPTTPTTNQSPSATTSVASQTPGAQVETPDEATSDRLKKLADVVAGSSYDVQLVLGAEPGFVDGFEENEPFKFVVNAKMSGWLILFSRQGDRIQTYYSGAVAVGVVQIPEASSGKFITLKPPYGEVEVYAALFERRVDVAELGGNLQALEKQGLIGYGKTTLVVTAKGSGGISH